MAVAQNTLTGSTQVATLPLWKSQVAVGIIVSLFFKALAAFKPEWAGGLTGLEADATQMIFLAISSVGDLVAFVSRVRSGLQPLTLSGSSPAKTLAILAFLPLLGGCVVSARTVTPPTGAVTQEPTQVDITIYETSQKVAQYCDIMRLAVSAGQWFAKEPQHLIYLQRAQGVVTSYCDNPVYDTRTALAFLVTAYDEILAVPGVRTEVRRAVARR